MMALVDSSVLCETGQVLGLCSHSYREGLAVAKPTLVLEFEL